MMKVRAGPEGIDYLCSKGTGRVTDRVLPT